MRLVPAAALCLGLAACQGEHRAQAPETVIEIGEALCRPTRAGRDVTGCYMTLTASRDDRLVSASSAAAARTEVHEMTSQDGIMRMSELVDGLPLPAGEDIRLQPGGNHIMLMGVHQPLAAGDTVELDLQFQHAGARTVTAQVADPALPGAVHPGHETP